MIFIKEFYILNSHLIIICFYKFICPFDKSKINGIIEIKQHIIAFMEGFAGMDMGIS